MNIKKMKFSYQQLCQELSKEECTLLTTEEEFFQICKKDRNLKVRILCSCNHERECFPYFLGKRQFSLCINCTRKNTENLLKKKYIYGYKPQDIEYTGYLHIYEYIGNEFKIEKTNEGCITDFIICEKNYEYLNSWIRVQLKTTQSISHGSYTFHINNNYQDHILMCNCVGDDKLWILPYIAFSHLQKNLSISSNKSKYNEYLVSRENVNERLRLLISTLKRFQYQECLIPISITQQQENNYANTRIKCISFLKFRKPNIENGKVDFYIEDKKFQEKVSCLVKHRYHVIFLYVNNGSINKKRNYRMYRVGENDFYWFNINNSTIFYIVPEIILFQNKYISDSDETLNRKFLNININPWLDDYKFDYKDIDKLRILELLKIKM